MYMLRVPLGSYMHSSNSMHWYKYILLGYYRLLAALQFGSNCSLYFTLIPVHVPC